MNTDEPILVGLYFSRDENAITVTKEKYGAYGHSIAYGILENVHDTAECENDAYYRLWCSIPPAVPQCFRTYFGRIVRALALDRLRKRQARKRSSLSEVMMELDDLIGTAPSPEQTVGETEIRDLLRRFLGALSPQTRDFFVQRYWYLKDVATIAEMHRCSEENVRVALYRARNALKKILTEEGYL